MQISSCWGRGIIRAQWNIIHLENNPFYGKEWIIGVIINMGTGRGTYRGHILMQMGTG